MSGARVGNKTVPKQSRVWTRLPFATLRGREGGGGGRAKSAFRPLPLIAPPADFRLAFVTRLCEVARRDCYVIAEGARFWLMIRVSA